MTPRTASSRAASAPPSTPPPRPPRTPMTSPSPRTSPSAATPPNPLPNPSPPRLTPPLTPPTPLPSPPPPPFSTTSPSRVSRGTSRPGLTSGAIPRSWRRGVALRAGASGDPAAAAGGAGGALQSGRARVRLGQHRVGAVGGRLQGVRRNVGSECVLPVEATRNLTRWAMEGKLPYVAAFTEVDKLLGSSIKDCPLDARQLFRPPVRVIGAWQLESAAGSIAQRIERILPHACRIYEWAMPAELWLSINPARVPTRVCVMAIIIVAIRVIYNINGQGIWEKIGEAGRNAGGSDPDVKSLFLKPGGGNNEFGARELLCTLAAANDKIDVGHGNFGRSLPCIHIMFIL